MRIALTGNPNSGKTTMYNALTGRNERVGNWAGVTVEKKESPIKKTELDNVKIGGITAELMENFFYERIFSKKAKNVVFRECEEAFLRTTDTL